MDWVSPESISKMNCHSIRLARPLEWLKAGRFRIETTWAVTAFTCDTAVSDGCRRRLRPCIPWFAGSCRTSLCEEESVLRTLCLALFAIPAWWIEGLWMALKGGARHSPPVERMTLLDAALMPPAAGRHGKVVTRRPPHEPGAPVRVHDGAVPLGPRTGLRGGRALEHAG